MPQLVPFYFFNPVVFAFTIVLLIYVFSKYILPRFVRFFKEYHASYKRWLSTLLGKKDISNVSSFIYTVLILLFMLLILLLILLIFLLFSAVFSEPIYCMDTLTETRGDLLAKIARLEEKIEYFADQAKETDRLFKEALIKNLPEDMRQERLIAKRETETNLNMGRKVLRTLKQRLDSGNDNTPLSTSSSLGKRNFDEE